MINQAMQFLKNALDNNKNYVVVSKIALNNEITQSYTLDQLLTEHVDLYSDITNFKLFDDNKSCRFYCIPFAMHVEFRLKEVPSDSAGNQVDLTCEIKNIQDGYYPVMFFNADDPNLNDILGDFAHFSDNFHDNLLFTDFLQWLLDNYRKYDSFLTEIKSLPCITNPWIILISSSPPDSWDWLDLLDDFEEEMRGSSNYIVDKDKSGNILYGDGSLNLMPRYFAVCKIFNTDVTLYEFFSNSLNYSDEYFRQIFCIWLIKHYIKYNFLTKLEHPKNKLVVIISALLPSDAMFRTILIDFYEDILKVR